jgi:hypothetical protein
MYTDVLRSIEGVAVFPVISLVVFVIVFSGTLVWALRLSADRLRRMAELPLDLDAARARRPGAHTGGGRGR